MTSDQKPWKPDIQTTERKKKNQPRILYLAKQLIKNEGKLRHSQINTENLMLQKNTKGNPKAQMKGYQTVSNLNLYEEIKTTNKSHYIGKYKSTNVFFSVKFFSYMI